MDLAATAAALMDLIIIGWVIATPSIRPRHIQGFAINASFITAVLLLLNATVINFRETHVAIANALSIVGLIFALRAISMSYNGLINNVAKLERDMKDENKLE